MENNVKILSFDSLPGEVAAMNRKLDLLLSFVSPQGSEKDRDRLLTLDELQNYLPEQPAKPTVYGWVNERKIPFEKHGRRLYFRKTSIDKWLENGRQIF